MAQLSVGDSNDADESLDTQAFTQISPMDRYYPCRESGLSWCMQYMKNSEIEIHSDIDGRSGQTIDMSPGNSKSLFKPRNSQPYAARVAVDSKALLAAFEQVVSRFESSHTLGSDPIISDIEVENFGSRYSDLERAFAAACPLNLETVPALEY